MKRIAKKQISVILALSISLMGLTGLQVGAEGSYEDYVPSAKAANLIPDASAGYGYTYIGARCANVSQELYNIDEETKGFYAKYSSNVAGPLALSESGWRGFEGFKLNQSMTGTQTDPANFGFVAEGGKTYVLSAGLKNDSANDVIPYVGTAMNNTWGTGSIVYSNEYGTQGMQLSNEWKQFNASITLPTDFVTNNGVGEYVNGINVGFPEGTEEGAAFRVDVSSKDSVYFAEEQAYDITCVKNKDTVCNGETLTATASIVNQVGTKGANKQSFQWTVLDDARENVVDIPITVSADTTSASITASSDTALGDYVLFAKSVDYNMGKGVSFSVENGFGDYVPGERAVNLIPDASSQAGYTYFGSRCVQTDYDTYKAPGITSGGYAMKYWYSGTDSFTLTDAWKGFEGFNINQSLTGDPTAPANFGFVPESGKTYVLSANFKNASTSGTVSYIGAALNNTYGPSSLVYTNEYGAEGMKIGSSWTPFKATITIPDNYTEATGNGTYANNIYVGFPAGTAPGAAIWMDASSKDAFYLAEEQVYDIACTADKNVIYQGETLMAYASVLNQVGAVGTLNQSFDWTVVNEGRDTAVDIPIVVSADTKSASITVGANVAPGNYVLVAKSKDYKISKGISFSVGGKRYTDYIAGNKPANLISDASAGGGATYLGNRNNGVIDNSDFYTPGITTGGYCFKYFYTGTEPFVLSAGWRGFEGFEVKHQDGVDFMPEGGKTYVISANVKNASTDGVTPYFGAAMNGTYDSGSVIATNEYGKTGMKVNDDWTEFKSTITLSDDWTAQHDYADRIFMGFPDGTPVGVAFWIDVSNKDAVYLAEEQAYDITLDADKGTILSDEYDINLSANVVNQIGTKGTLPQNFKWTALNASKTQEVDGIYITPMVGSSMVNISWDEDLPYGKYVIAAESEDYVDFTRTIELHILGNVENVYVAQDGNDSATGAENDPLKTLAGAKNKIKALRESGVDTAIDVIFKEGTYHIDSTVDFAASDSNTASQKVTYKAAEGQNVVFTGSVDLDLANAKKVTDSTILSKLKENVRDKVVELDLSNTGLDLGSDQTEATIQQLYGNYESPELYLDGEEQAIAQWPNGNGNYARYDYVDNGDSVASDKFLYSDSNPSSWTTNVGDIWIGGFMTYDYLYMRLPVTSIDAANKQIFVATKEALNLEVQQNREVSKRWKAFNVLEELDTPTEWYIDKNTNKLYYYAPDTMENRKLEISTLKNSMINITGASNIAFENIEFQNTRGNAITATDVENIILNGCTFKNIGVNAFEVKGTKNAVSDADYWQVQTVDAAYGCEISDSVFYNIGGHAIVMDGGNVDTLTPSQNIIQNNILNKCSQKIKNYEAILVKGCGTNVINNNISRCAFIAIRHYGNDHVISYNEIYNAIQETDDVGAIYSGRNTIQRGSVISYNYIHDLYSTEELPFGHQPAIYWDDNQTGMKAYSNIIKDANINVYTNGIDNDFSNNTSINIKKTNLDFKNGGAASNNNTETAAFSGTIANPELYYKTYPNLKAIVESSSRTSASLAKYNTIKNNICVNGPGGNGIGTNNALYASRKNNVDNASASDFVNPEAQDYRVKNTSSYASSVLNENFNIESIGVLSSNAITSSKITLVAPVAGEAVNSGALHFMWDDSLGATSYRVTVAKDQEFTNVVASSDSYYNYADIAVPAGGDTYYWKVTAKNTSREFASTWESDTKSFTNGEKISASAVLDGSEANISITNNHFESGKNVFVYICEYNADGRLLNVIKLAKSLTYQTPVVFSENVNTAAASINLLVWEGNTPLTASVPIK